MAENQIYLGNPNLKKANVATNFTPKQVQEFIKCSKDPVYFIKKYIKIVSLDEGVIPFDLYDFQEEMVNRFHNNRFNTIPYDYTLFAKVCNQEKLIFLGTV